MKHIYPHLPALVLSLLCSHSIDLNLITNSWDGPPKTEIEETVNHFVTST